MQIPKEVIAALIALVGVLLSVSISLITSRKTINIELSKLRFQLKGAYIEELLKKRILVYPGLYSHLSAFVKRIQYRELAPDAIETLLRKLDEWDLENTVFLSRTSIKHFIELQNHLAALTNRTVMLPEIIATKEFEKNMLRLVGTLQLSLRGDLGIYGFEFSTSEEEGRPITPERWFE